MAHSRAPWKVTGQSEGGRYITVQAADGRVVARVPWNTEKQLEAGPATDNDDAVLISMSPEILDALEHATTRLRMVAAIANSLPRRYAAKLVDVQAYSDLEAVIAKANARPARGK